MVQTNCVGIFCEDIREEVGGTHTIVGVMPDNIVVAAPPNTDPKAALLFPRISIYVRVNIHPSRKPTSITAKVSIPGMADLSLGQMETETVDKAFEDAIAKDAIMVSIIFKATLSPVQLTTSGRATATVTIDGVEIICAALNIQITR